jgi:phytoene/squalene synthetase
LQRARRSDPETYQSELEANAAARRLKRSLSRVGLPPKLLHATTAAERRSNEREADAYFGAPSLPEHLRQFTVFAESLTEHMLENGARMHEFAEAYVETRARMGLPSVPVGNIVYARAVELVAERMRRVDLLTSRDVAAAVRSTQTGAGERNGSCSLICSLKLSWPRYTAIVFG